ncbi:Flagella accessory protein C (FlaC) [Natronoarchaeum philippinense]|uniref:Flagella accessory protein C (FlaC) n=1 Tax=Natronoarchaeum philippinense TaxID=558529 RepID=A0A285N7Y4_NATPI|nr:FlaD/FlaE family flagellar protein [Natronoarchaeum philippinense]SNZ05592.1 Flagella accessory protein C (FlaC) [Natronoarchaeum philippinense]
MNIGTILDELGLDALAPGGPDRPDAGPDGPQDDDSEEDEESEAVDEQSDGEESTGSRSGGLFGGRSSDDADDELVERLDDVEYEIDQIRNDVEQNEATIEGIESEQLDLHDRMGQIEEHNATLLGVYDQLTDGVNPFTDSWDHSSEPKANGGESTYGVIPNEDDDSPEQEERRTRKRREGRSRRDETADSTDDEQDADDADERAPTPSPEPASTPVPETPPSGTTPPENGPYLTEFADTYATDVLVMEWLSMLIDTAGEEGALKALDHYDRIDWVSESIRRQLEVVLSGAWSESDTAPRNDLSTDVHDRSFRFIARLSQQAQLAKTDHRR